jgi:hypothetical protein
MVEKHIINKFEKKITIDMSRVVKLFKSLAGYYIKHEQLCYFLKNYIETYLNGYIAREGEGGTPEEQPKNINVEFSEAYYKLVTNLNIIIWAISKNETFLRLKDPEFVYFFNRLKEIFIKNLEFYNERETAFTIDGLIKMNTEFSASEVELLNKKILELRDYVPHDSVMLLRNFIHKRLGSKESLLHLITVCYKNFEKLTYTELVEFINILSTIPEIFMTLINENKIAFYEKRLLPILPKIDIKVFCQVIKLSYKLCNSHEFIEAMRNVLQSRANEIPKELFSDTLFALVNTNHTEGVLKMLDILEDLSNFEKLEDVFKQPIETLNLLWSCLTMTVVHDKGGSGHKKFMSKYIDTVLNYNDSEGYIDKLLEIIKPQSFIYNTSDYPVLDYEINVIKYIQTLYLALQYVINKYGVSKVIYNELNDKLHVWAKTVGPAKLTNIINTDPATRCNKDVLEDLQNELLVFFKPKANATLYPNFVDPAFNLLNIVIKFTLPRMNEGQYVTGIDAKTFGVILLNQHYYINNNLMSIYENRFKILKDVFEWEVVKINQEEWLKCSDKQSLLRDRFGFDFTDDKNLMIQVNEGGRVAAIEDSGDRKPKFNLAKKILSKKN